MLTHLLFIVALVQTQNLRPFNGPFAHWQGASAPIQPLLSFDTQGNCYAQDRLPAGRCVPFQSCISAVHAWNELQLVPLYCPISPFFVCCPHGGYELTKSELACRETYFPQFYQKRHRRNVVESAVSKEPKVKLNHLMTRVVGGKRAQRDQHSYMCALGWRTINNRSGKRPKYIYNCGCVLISPRFVLTVAHCANFSGEAPKVALIGGADLNNTSDGELRKIKHIMQHPSYDEETSYNDIALVKLEKNVHHLGACLWRGVTVPTQQLTALGYGQTKFAGPTSNALLEIQLYWLENKHCDRFFAETDIVKTALGPGQICAGDYGGHMDTCQGDSGGPLLFKQQNDAIRIPYVIGLTSFGGSCALGAPSVYTRISYYLDWIESHVW